MTRFKPPATTPPVPALPAVKPVLKAGTPLNGVSPAQTVLAGTGMTFTGEWKTVLGSLFRLAVGTYKRQYTGEGAERLSIVYGLPKEPGTVERFVPLNFDPFVSKSDRVSITREIAADIEVILGQHRHLEPMRADLKIDAVRQRIREAKEGKGGVGHHGGPTPLPGTVAKPEPAPVLPELGKAVEYGVSEFGNHIYTFGKGEQAFWNNSQNVAAYIKLSRAEKPIEIGRLAGTMSLELGQRYIVAAKKLQEKGVSVRLLLEHIPLKTYDAVLRRMEAYLESPEAIAAAKFLAPLHGPVRRSALEGGVSFAELSTPRHGLDGVAVPVKERAIG